MINRDAHSLIDILNDVLLDAQGFETFIEAVPVIIDSSMNAVP